jgi:hypothetical protein
VSSPRQPAYDAVYAVIRQYPTRTVGDYDSAAENARVWRAVEAALDAMGVPTGDRPADAETGPSVGWHVEDCRCLESNGAVLNVDLKCDIP